MTNPTTPHLHLILILILILILSSLFCPCYISAATPTASAPANVKVGIILDLNSPVGLISRTAIRLAASDYYASNPNSTTRLLLLRTRDSRRDVVAAAAAAVDLLVNDEVHAIIGPQSSSEAAFVAELGTRAHVPVIAFSAMSPTVSPARTPYFVRAAPSDAAQAQAMAALAVAFGWRRVVPIYQDDDFGAAFIPYLDDALYAVGVQVPYRSAIPADASGDRIRAELYRLDTMQTRVFVLHATSAFAPRLLAAAAEAGMMGEGYAWIATAALTSVLGSLDPSHVLKSMQGVLGLRAHIPMRSPKLQQFRRRWRLEFLNDNPTAPDDDVPELTAMGVWAYDAVWAVAAAVEASATAVTATAGFDRPSNSSGSDLAAIGVSKSGQKLLNSILEAQFEGLGGTFRLDGGERNVTAFEVVNVIGERERVIGYWTARHGLSGQLNSTNASYSAKRDELGAVIWPGDSTAVPKGWVEPVGERRLRIAVPGPVEPGFHGFLDIERDPATNETVASGFVIDVFEAAVAALPYALPYEFVAYQNGAGKSAGNYNDLVKQVYDGKFDAVVGDVTITANRSLIVDFTLPYTESGMSMVVPAKDERSKDAWLFVKPLTPDLWLVSFAAFVFTGTVVWILEHRINEEFRGPPSHQIGTVFYFSFSTLVFAHKETLVSNLSRVVVIVWVFVVLILQSSYIASLTSMLTVQKLQPTVTDFSELIRNKEYVGYLEDSFVRGLLVKMGFDESRLRPYKSPQQYEEALSKGSRNGGVAAVVDEIPYLKVFLKNYCDGYTMAGQTYKTGGFGFVFPTGSPIVPDLSRAILNVAEGDKMLEIEKKWFGDQTTCPTEESPFSSNSLDFKSFWGLFLITGIASVVSLLYSVASFLYKHRDVLNDNASKSSVSLRIRSIAKVFDQKDLTSYTFKKAEPKDGSSVGITGHITSPYANGTESPSFISNQMYEGGTPRTVPTSPFDEGTPRTVPTSPFDEGETPRTVPTSPYQEGTPRTVPTSPSVEVSNLEMTATNGW